MLNPHSPVPLYHQLADLIMARIRSGEYPPGSRIPSEHSLAASFGIGRPTARQAIDVLVRKRALTRRRGSGTYVTPDREEVDLFSLAGTMSSFHKKGISLNIRILQKTALKPVPLDPENPFSESSAYFLSRLSLVEETPVLIEDIYLHPEMFKGIDAIDLAERSLSRVADEHYYLKPTSGRQNFRIGYLNEDKVGLLGVTASTPILAVKRFLHFSQARNAVYSEIYCRTDQFVFSQTIGGISDD